MGVQQSFKMSPYSMRVNCPAVLPKMIDVKITHVDNQEMTITVADYIPGNVVVEIVGNEHIIKYEGHQLAIVDINIPMKKYAVSLPVVGIVDNTAEVEAELTSPQGMIKVANALVCTQGLLKAIPPVNVEVSTTYNFAVKEITYRAAA